jgi:hypothetical protein
MTRLIVAGLAVALTALNWMTSDSWVLAIWMTAAQFVLFLLFGLGHIAIERHQQDLEVRKAAEDAARFLSGEWREY